ncbi:MAG: hypothetical protein ACT4QB_15265 [Gammaproteobacteria bacterium]
MSARPQPADPGEPEGASRSGAIVQGRSNTSGQALGEMAPPGRAGSSATGPVGQAVGQHPQIVSTSEASRLERIREAQATLYRYLRYAASRSDIGLGKDLIDPLIPLLRQDAGAMSPADEAVLWDGYNRLSKLVAPATDESLEIADQIRQARATYPHNADTWPIVARIRRELRKIVVLLIIMVAIFLVTQAYVIVLTDVLQDHKSLREEHRSVFTQIQTLRAANPDLKDEAVPLQPLLDRHAELEGKMTVSSRAEAHLMAMWWWVYPKPDGMDGAREPDAAEDVSVRMFAVEDYARSLLGILSQYVLPLILGLLGAVAYLVRRALFNLAYNSYTPSFGGQFAMRLSLGGLLGVIAGIMFSLDEAEIETYSLSLVVVAFLMGYSVEFAFSLFDRAIERGRSLLKPEARSCEPTDSGQDTNKA